MTSKFFMLCAIVTGASIASGPVCADDNLRVLKYAETGNWTVSALYDQERFVTCYASVKYKNDISLSLHAYAGGDWKVQFYNERWPKRSVSQFPAKLDVDGRVVVDGMAEYRGNSVFISLGQSKETLRAIMYGNVMGVLSESGVSRFKLTGSKNAARKVSACWAYHRDQSRDSGPGAFGAAPSAGNSGAFGNGPQRENNGAFGGPAASNNHGESFPGRGRGTPGAPDRQPVVLSRKQTMEFALKFLAKSQTRYEILPHEKNFFRHFPVNWRYANGRIGGLMVLDSTTITADAGISKLLSDHAQNCAGRRQARRAPTIGEPGQRIAKAVSSCEAGATISKLEFAAVELGPKRLALIVTLTAQPQARTTPPGASRSPTTRRRTTDA
ncbi:MAG: hypothetical protein AAGC70_04980 [Pseudomonadota bacterium]